MLMGPFFREAQTQSWSDLDRRSRSKCQSNQASCSTCLILERHHALRTGTDDHEPMSGQL